MGHRGSEGPLKGPPLSSHLDDLLVRGENRSAELTQGPLKSKLFAVYPNGRPTHRHIAIFNRPDDAVPLFQVIANHHEVERFPIAIIEHPLELISLFLPVFLHHDLYLGLIGKHLDTEVVTPEEFFVAAIYIAKKRIRILGHLEFGEGGAPELHIDALLDRPAALLVDHLVYLGHDPNRLMQRDDDPVIALDVALG